MPGALTGIRVLDFTRTRTTPFSTQILTDFGAEVIKIEPPGGENGRFEEPIIEGTSAYFFAVNRNKKSVTLNLKDTNDVAAFKQLVTSSDVVIESFRPGVMDRLGIGYEDLRAINPKIIFCSLSGFGSTGPYSHVPGHDINFQAISGLLGLTGTSDGQPAVSQVPLAGFAGGDMYAVIAILLALFYRERTGIGQYCDISMLDSAISYLSSGLAAWSGWGKLPPMGADSLTGGFAYYNIYRTADWRWLSLGAIELKFWTAFCERLERPKYIEWQFDPDRQEAIIADLRQIFAQKTMSEWLEHFADLDICLAPVLTLEETAEHPQVQARQMIFPAPHDSHAGNCMLAGSPIKMSVTPPEIKPIYARAGEHNEEILNSK